ncbi:MAG: hypothetical protein KIH67_001320 [Candidatus Moranbacteria bacterium]|nr:hypothetical protein [Candidatus Moranbacteria bacterium]
MNISLQEIQIKLERFSLRKLTLAWYRYFKVIFALLFLAVIGWGSFIWYQSLYNFHWNDEQKKSYMETVTKETNLKQKEFDKLLASLKERESKHNEESPIDRNLFTGEPVIKQ